MYRTIRKENAHQGTGTMLLDQVGTLQGLGVDIPQDLLTSLQGHREKLEHINTTRKEADPATAAQRAARALADGTGTIADVFNGAAARVLLDKTPGSNLNSIFDEALRMNSAAIVKELAALGDTWVELLKPAVEARVKTVTAAHRAPRAVDGDDLRTSALNHLRHIPGVSEAMSELQTLIGVSNSFRSYQIVPTKIGRRADEYLFTQPKAGAEHHADNIEANDITWLVWSAQNEMNPSIYTEAEVAGRS